MSIPDTTNSSRNSTNSLNYNQIPRHNTGLSRGAKMVAAGTGLGFLGLCYLTLQQPSPPTPSWGFNWFQSSEPASNIPLITTAITLISAIGCYLTGGPCTRVKEENEKKEDQFSFDQMMDTLIKQKLQSLDSKDVNSEDELKDCIEDIGTILSLYRVNKEPGEDEYKAINVSFEILKNKSLSNHFYVKNVLISILGTFLINNWNDNDIHKQAFSDYQDIMLEINQDKAFYMASECAFLLRSGNQGNVFLKDIIDKTLNEPNLNERAKNDVELEIYASYDPYKLKTAKEENELPQNNIPGEQENQLIDLDDALPSEDETSYDEVSNAKRLEYGTHTHKAKQG